MSHLVILLNVLIASTIYATTIDFTCNDNDCSCLHGECHHTCLPQECSNKSFVCPSSATSCVLNCDGYQSCKDTQIYGAADTVEINCNGTHACDGTQIFCGVPDSLSTGYLSATYETDQFSGAMTDCFVNVLTSNAMSLGDISCNGNIQNCVINAHEINAISQSSFQCTTARTDGNGCQINCVQAINCNSVEFECNSPLCSCGILDEHCSNAAVHLTKNTPSSPPQTTQQPAEEQGNIIEVKDQYNCMDLIRTELQIRSIVTANPNGAKESAFNYEICGKDTHHNTVLYRYKYESEDVDSRSLSSSVHDIHRSVDFIEHEENGETYDFEWEFNEPNIICWLTDELSAIKIDLFYDRNISFAFTIIYYDDIVAKGRYQLTAKNNWNLGITYLETRGGYIYFDYHYNITLYNPLTWSPTTIPTVDPTAAPTPEPSNNIIVITDDDPQQSESSEDVLGNGGDSVQTTASSEREREVVESTGNELGDNNVRGDGGVNMNVTNNHETGIKALLFGIGITSFVCICALIVCIIYHQKKRQKHSMEAAYASAAGGDSSGSESDDRIGIGMISKGRQGDIEEEEIDTDEIGPLHLPNERMSSGILDENDLMDDSEYMKRMHAGQNAGQRESASAHSQTSLIKKYVRRDASTILPGQTGKFAMISNDRKQSQSQSRSGSGVGYVAKGGMLAADDYEQGISDDEDESLMARERDISMDEEYHHVITHQPEISTVQMQEEEILNRGHMDMGTDEDEEPSVSISIPVIPYKHSKHNKNASTSVTLTYSKQPNARNVFHESNTTLGFEPGSVLDHYVNQDSTFDALQGVEEEEEEKREISVSQSMSRLSQSLVIPPIQLNEDITNVKTYKTKSTMQSATESMKLFSQKIAKAAVQFGKNVMDDNDNQEEENEREDSNQFATMVIYRNENISDIAQSQIMQSSTPPPITSVDAVNSKFLEPVSTQTMIVKNINTMQGSKSVDTRIMSQLQASHEAVLTEDSSESSSDGSGRDPIDVSEEEEVAEKRRHRKNLSSISDRSHHDRRTMIINDDLRINELVNSINEQEESDNNDTVHDI